MKGDPNMIGVANHIESETITFHYADGSFLTDFPSFRKPPTAAPSKPPTRAPGAPVTAATYRLQ